MDTAYFSHKICFLLLLFCMAPGFSPEGISQLPGMRKYTLIDGYTATNGYVIQQDQRGFIWLGTENGALRFDGKKFQLLRDKLRPADQEILSCNPYGDDQVLLVPLLNNITYYKKGDIFSGRRDKRLNHINNRGRNSAFLDAITGNMWLADDARLATLYCFTAQDIRRIAVGDTAFRIVAIRNNQAIGFTGQKGKLLRYIFKEQKYKPLYNARMQPMQVRGGFETKEDGRYIFSFGKKDSDEKLEIYRFLNDSVLQLVKTAPQLSRLTFTDQQLHLWYRFAEGGVAYLDESRSVIDTFSLFSFMNKTVINYLFVDRAKNIWMSGQNNSLYFISSKHFRNALLVKNLQLDAGIPKFIQGDAQGNMGIGYVNQKLFSIRTKGSITHFKLNQDFYEGVRCICPLGNNRFLIMDKDLALVDGSKGSIRYFSGASTYKDMALYADGGLLVASLPNAFYLSPRSLASGNALSAQKVIFEGRTSAIASLPDSTVLVGTPDGLFVKKGLLAEATRVDHPDLSHINITDIISKGRQGALISTNGQGVYYYHSGTGKAEAVKVFAGQVRRMFKQNDSLFWLATEKGTFEVKMGAGAGVLKVRNYTFYNGLPSNNITSVYVQQDTAFVTSAEGPGIIPLNDTTLSRMKAPLTYLNNVRLKDTLFQQPAGGLELSYRQNDLLISLSAISYESFGNTRYYYQLEGLTEEWTETDNPEIRFSGLPPGNYLFKAYAVNAQGTRSAIPVTLRIRILPAFWQTVLFKSGLFLLLLAALYLFIRRRALKLTLKKYERARQQRRLAELELEAIKAQINPHFIYNCLNSIQYFNYEKQHDEARQYLDLFARLIRLTMQYSRETFISIAEETVYLSNYLQLEQMRFHERLRYEIIVADNIDQQSMIPAMLIQPYVENALKHGIAGRKEGGSVHVRFERPDEHLLLVSIEDDGVGLGAKQQASKRSLGLRLSGSRAETYNQLFGTQIEIDFFNKKSYHPDQSGVIVQLKIPVKSYEHAVF